MNYWHLILIGIGVVVLFGGGTVLGGWIYAKAKGLDENRPASTPQDRKKQEFFEDAELEDEHPFDFSAVNQAENLHQKNNDDYEGFSFDD